MDSKGKGIAREESESEEFERLLREVTQFLTVTDRDHASSSSTVPSTEAASIQGMYDSFLSTYKEWQEAADMYAERRNWWVKKCEEHQWEKEMDLEVAFYLELREILHDAMVRQADALPGDVLDRVVIRADANAVAVNFLRNLH